MKITEEMAFGMLVMKWRILRTSLEVPLAQSASILTTCGILHNWCITKHRKEVNAEHDIENQVAYQNGSTVLGFMPSNIDTVPTNGSILQKKLDEKIAYLLYYPIQNTT